MNRVVAAAKKTSGWLDAMSVLPGFDLSPPAGAEDPHADADERGTDGADDLSADDEHDTGEPVAAEPDTDEPEISGSRTDEHVRLTETTVPTTEVIRSRRRTRTVGWHVRNGVLQITVPSWMSKADEARWVADIERRMAKKMAAQRIDLRERAKSLASKYSLPLPSEIKWSDDMNHRWGSCTPSTRVVRISSRLVPFPAWVLDYVIVHELAHIAVPDHSPEFWTVVNRYPKVERATGYLIAKSGDDESIDD